MHESYIAAEVDQVYPFLLFRFVGREDTCFVDTQIERQHIESRQLHGTVEVNVALGIIVVGGDKEGVQLLERREVERQHSRRAAAQHDRIGADAVVFENPHEDKVQIGIAAVSCFDHFVEVSAVKLVSAVPGELLLQYPEGGDDFLLECHFAGKGGYGFFFKRIVERQVLAEKLVFGLGQLLVHVFPLLAEGFVFSAGEMGALQVEADLYFIIFGTPAV